MPHNTDASEVPYPSEQQMDRAFVAYQNEVWWAAMREADHEVPPVVQTPIPRWMPREEMGDDDHN